MDTGTKVIAHGQTAFLLALDNITVWANSREREG
jgi:hypothetical protein